MLTDIDRVLIASPDAEDTAARWRALLGAEDVARDTLSTMAAKRIILRAGDSDIEILEPDGAGVVADELARRGRAHLFAAGASSPDIDDVVRTAAAAGALVEDADGRRYITVTIEGAPIRFVISQATERKPAGDVNFLYEATILAANQAAAVDQLTDVFGLDPASFQTITSEKFGYTGVLTLFEAGRLHRFEVITPTDMAKTMGRFYGREGACFYMCFADSSKMYDIEQRALDRSDGHTSDRPDGRGEDQSPDQLWLHPPALGGMMLGLSRPTMAWTWSGFPERVEAFTP